MATLTDHQNHILNQIKDKLAQHNKAQTIKKERDNGTVKAKIHTDNPKPAIQLHTDKNQKHQLTVKRTRYGLKITFTHQSVDYHIQIQTKQT